MDQQAGSRESLKGIGFAVLATLLWSGNFIVARAFHKEISPVSLAFFRWLVATLILLPLAYKHVRKDWNIIKRSIPYLAVVGLTGVTVFNTLIYVAGKYTSATNLALIGTTAAPVFVLFITGMILKQSVYWTQIAGAVICILGILVLLVNGDMAAIKDFHFNRGDVLILVAAFSFAIYTVLVRRKPSGLSGLAFLFVVFLLGTILLFPAYLIELPQAKSIQWNSQAILVFLYLGVGASVLAFLLWNYAIKSIGAARTSLFGNLIPAFSALEAAILLHEKFTAVTMVSVAIIFSGILLGNSKLLKQATVK